MKRPNYHIVRRLLQKHVALMSQLSLLGDMGIEIGILNNLNLDDVALDIIGFPPDNTTEFNYSTDPAFFSPVKRTDFENRFCRDPWCWLAFELRPADIDGFVEKLYDDYDTLILQRPHLFVLRER